MTATRSTARPIDYRVDPFDLQLFEAVQLLGRRLVIGLEDVALRGGR